MYLGAPQTASNYAFLNGWFDQEHPSSQLSSPSIYDNNPFFSSLGAGGSGGGVKAGTFPGDKQYPSLADYPDTGTGVLATGITLEQYPTIVAALRSGDPESYAGSSNLQHELSTWSGGGYSTVTPSKVDTPTGAEFGNLSMTDLQDLGGKGSALDGIPFGGTISNAASAASSAVSSATAPITNAASSIEKAAQDISNPNLWLRILEIVGGVALVGLGLYLLAKDLGLPGPGSLPGPAGAAAGAVEDAQASLVAAKVETAQANARAATHRAAAAEHRANMAQDTAGSRRRSFDAPGAETRARVRRRVASQDAGGVPF
jgi:hypothetical protein